MTTSTFPPELLRLGGDAYLGAGAVLWNEGDPGGDVALVLDGSLEVYRPTPDGDVVLDVVDPGQAVGELALDGGTRTAAVRARTAAHVLRVGADDFRRLLRERPDILETLYWTQVNRMRRVAREAAAHRPRRVLEPRTGACSYPFFIERLETELRRAAETGEPVSLVVCEIDALEPYVRDPAADADAAERARTGVLAPVVRLLRERAGRGDVVARTGASQITVLLYGAGREAAAERAERFRAGVAGHELPSPPSSWTVSVAVVAYPADGADVAALLRAADARLYRAREAGGDRVVAEG